MVDATEGVEPEDLGVPGITQAHRIGSGGFGTVYRATEADLRRQVAVKLLRTLDERGRDRFDRERGAMGALSGHPNIVIVHRSGFTDDGRAYIVMEYLEPGSLDDHLRSRGVLGWRAAATIGIEISGALESAHRAGVLHRDIKPGNILMSPTGAAKLADFGIARISGSPETTSSTITASVAHAAPEVIDGHRPTAAADVYSLASTLFELVAGHAPFHRPSDESMVPMLARIARDPLPPVPGAPASLHTVLSYAMAKDPAARYPTAVAFGEALQHVVDVEHQPSTTGPVVMETTTFAPPPAPTEASPAAPTPAPLAQSSPIPTGAPSAPLDAPVHTPDSTASPGQPWYRGGRGIGVAVAASVVAVLVIIGGVAAFGRDEGPTESTDVVTTVSDPDTLVAPTDPASTDTTAITEPEEPTTIPQTTEPTTDTTAPTTEVAPGATFGPAGGLPVETGADYPDYSTLVDASGAIQVDVPTEWGDVEIGVGALQPTLLASNDLALAESTFAAPGVAITVAAGPLIDADAVLAAAIDPECVVSPTGPYQDPLYSGRFLVLDRCGGFDTRIWVVASAPEANNYWILVAVQAVTPQDETAAKRILDTFVVDEAVLFP